MKKPFFFNSTNILVGIRFIARLMVVALFIVFITLFITEPASQRNLNPFGLAIYESLLVVAFYAALAGLIIAFSFEGLGGFMTIAGLTAFSILYYMLKGAMLWNIWILGLPAVLFLICWWFTNYSADYDVYRS
ncbi:MAG: hypothetical protein K0Q79_1544 [Flavipsychrobacter sp.]|jgi:hypothetical protein|nr:hypothetical protein [Flavipsychrobacter sp.]